MQRHTKRSRTISGNSAELEHYYPRKIDFALLFFETLMSEVAMILDIDSYAQEFQLDVEEAYLLGCLYYGYLFDDEGGRKLLFDILKDREFSDELMRAHYEWGLEYVDPTRPDFDHRSFEVITTWGGFYELMYLALKQDFDPNLPISTIPILTSFLADNPNIHVDEKRLKDIRIDPKKLETLKEAMRLKMSQNEPSIS